ncbi:ABC transporter periplasmic protein [Enterobacter cancerogenus]|uniref:ABC transporter periplasmic protein n=1 Tax=Enterobacter cancerogenus TaxID=69218 RepID=A0A484Y7F2_9ENTR|nr:ABC transporter periplasmic protein [Enterobacter cancerogenus]
MKQRFWQAVAFCALILLPLSSQASRQITDQIGRTVTIPDDVDRVVVLQHQTLNLLVQMHATDKIVGVMANWKQQLGEGYARLAPELNQKATLGDLTHVDPEKAGGAQTAGGICHELCAAGDDRQNRQSRHPGRGDLPAPRCRR